MARRPLVADDSTGDKAENRASLGRAAGGIAWGYASYGISKLLVFGSTVVLARLLSPTEFGVVGYALVVIGYLEIARDFGIGAALIARPTVDRDTASTAFHISVVWGLALTVALFLGAPLLGEFFHDPRAIPVARALSLTFLLSALGSTHDALLYRSLAFNRRIVPDVAQALVKGVVSVGLALAGYGYWSLVVGQLAGGATFTVMAWVLQPFRPRVEWDLTNSGWLISFGSAVVGARMLGALLSNLGYLIVGSTLGAAALGIVTLAFRVPDLAMLSIYGILSTVLFPVYARLQDDQYGLRRGYFLAQRYMTLYAFPIGAMLFVSADLFVKVFYGPAWAEAAPVMQIFAVRASMAAVGWHAGDIAKAVGRARLQFALLAVPVGILLPLMLLAARSGNLHLIVGSYALGTTINALTNTVMLRRVVHMPVTEALRALWPGAATAVLVAAAMEACLLVSGGLPDLPRLLLLESVGGAAFLGGLALFGRDLVKRVLGQVRPRLAAQPVAEP